MRRLLVVLAIMVAAACSPAERMSYQVMGTGVAYETNKEEKTPGGYRAQGVYDSEMTKDGKVKPDEVRWRTLYNGLMTVQKDGYAYATIAGPLGISLRRSVSSRYSSSSYTTHLWPGFAYIIRGYKADQERPPAARPIQGLVDESNRRAHAAAGTATN
jgi:hypothetical protein